MVAEQKRFVCVCGIQVRCTDLKKPDSGGNDVVAVHGDGGGGSYREEVTWALICLLMFLGFD